MSKRARCPSLVASVSTLSFPSLGQIRGLQEDAGGGLFIATASAIYTISATGRIALFAGSPNETGFCDGDGCKARFNNPTGMAVAPDGRLLVADCFNNCLRCVSPHGNVTTLAGSAEGEKGFEDGKGADARFHCPWAVVVDTQSGCVYVSDCLNHCIRKVVPGEWAVSTFCGGGGRADGHAECGYFDGEGTQARLCGPRGIALDYDKNLIIADSDNHAIRVVTGNATVTTLAGSLVGGDEAAGFADGQGSSARFDRPLAVAVDGKGAILVADRNNHRVRKIDGPSAHVSTLAGSAESGNADGEGLNAQFNDPWVISIDEKGHLLVAELVNTGCLRLVEASLCPPPHLSSEDVPEVSPRARALADYGQLLEQKELADVNFVVDGQRFHGHRCVLAARSEYFKGLFNSGWRMREGTSNAGDVAIEGVRAGAFRVLLRYLYTEEVPEEEDCGEGLETGEMATVADRFQAQRLYHHCVGLFREALTVGTVVQRLAHCHDNNLQDLKMGALEFLRENALTFQVDLACCLELVNCRLRMYKLPG